MFHFELQRPQGALAHWVQAIWSVKLEVGSPALKRHLLSDGGCALVFNDGAPVRLAGTVLPAGVSVLPVKQRAEEMHLSAGAQLSGIRFQPAVGSALFGVASFSRTELSEPWRARTNALSIALQSIQSPAARVDYMSNWLLSLRLDPTLPAVLTQALQALESGQNLQGYSLAQQRQLQRHFKHWLGLSPKYFQRVRRVRALAAQLRRGAELDLAALALQYGFSDQAHMNREFRTLCGMTPKTFAQMR